MNVNFNAVNTPAKQFYSTREMAALLGISEKTVLRWTAENALPQPTMNRVRCKRWRASVVHDWLKAQEAANVRKAGLRPENVAPFLRNNGTL